jgi:ferric-dicitrate binding protein FerR (iron transport regulator)
VTRAVLLLNAGRGREGAGQPSAVAALLARAQALLEQCENEAAVKFCQRATETAPDHADAWELLATALVELGDTDKAQQVHTPYPRHVRHGCAPATDTVVCVCVCVCTRHWRGAWRWRRTKGTPST